MSGRNPSVAANAASLTPDAQTLLAGLMSLADRNGFVQIGSDRLRAACRRVAQRDVRDVRRAAAELERRGLLLHLAFCIDPERSYYGPAVWLLRLPETKESP